MISGLRLALPHYFNYSHIFDLGDLLSDSLRAATSGFPVINRNISRSNFSSSSSCMEGRVLITSLLLYVFNTKKARTDLKANPGAGRYKPDKFFSPGNRIFKHFFSNSFTRPSQAICFCQAVSFSDSCSSSASNVGKFYAVPSAGPKPEAFLQRFYFCAKIILVFQIIHQELHQIYSIKKKVGKLFFNGRLPERS